MIDLNDEEEEKGEPVTEEESKKSVSASQGPTCPIYPASVRQIMSTVERLDRGEIDDFDAVKEISGFLKEHRKSKLAALEKAETLGKPEKRKE